MNTSIKTLLLLMIAIYSMQAQQMQSVDSQAKITVNGEAIVKVQPDHDR